jgi:hypothetical protein
MPQVLRELIWDRIFYEYVLADADDETQTGPTTTPLINTVAIFSEQLHNLIIFTTYGFASPLLALAVGLAVTTQTWVWRMVLGRHLSQISSSKMTQKEMQTDKILVKYQELERAVGNSWQVPSELFFYVMCFALAFWAFVFFDYVADDPFIARESPAPMITSLVTALVSPAGILFLILCVKCAQQHPAWSRAAAFLERMISIGNHRLRSNSRLSGVAFGITPSMKVRATSAGAGAATATNPIFGTNQRLEPRDDIPDGFELDAHL